MYIYIYYIIICLYIWRTPIWTIQIHTATQGHRINGILQFYECPTHIGKQVASGDHQIWCWKSVASNSEFKTFKDKTDLIPPCHSWLTPYIHCRRACEMCEMLYFASPQVVRARTAAVLHKNSPRLCDLEFGMALYHPSHTLPARLNSISWVFNCQISLASLGLSQQKEYILGTLLLRRMPCQFCGNHFAWLDYIAFCRGIEDIVVKQP